MVEKGKMEPLHSKEEGRTAANPMALFKEALIKASKSQANRRR